VLIKQPRKAQKSVGVSAFAYPDMLLYLRSSEFTKWAFEKISRWKEHSRFPKRNRL